MPKLLWPSLRGTLQACGDDRKWIGPGKVSVAVTDLNTLVPELHDESFGALIEVTNGVTIAVERSMHWDANGVFWSGGTNSPGTKLPRRSATQAARETPSSAAPRRENGRPRAVMRVP
jgi:hypothetical protein